MNRPCNPEGVGPASWQMRLTALVTAGTTLLGMAAYEGQESPLYALPDDAGATLPTFDHTPGILGWFYENATPGPCYGEKLSMLPEIYKASAETCKRAKEAGRILLVISDGIKLTDAQIIADGIENTLPQVTGGLVNAEVQVAEASSEAQALRWAESNTPNCVSTTEQTKTSWPSVAAALTMPEARSADFVMGLSGLNSCNNTASGLADRYKTGRFAEILAGSIDPHFSPEQRIQILTEAAAHEALHLYGLGHAGTLLGVSPDGYYSELHAHNLQPGTVFDLGHYITYKSRYDEYSGGNVMGNGTELPDKPLLEHISPIQHDQLLWHQRALYGNKVSLAHPCDQEPVTITYDDALGNHFGILTLKKPIRLSGEGMDPQYAHDFDTIAVLPIRLESKDQSYISSVELALVDSSYNNYVTLGEVGFVNLQDPTKIWTLVLGDQQLTISLNSNEMVVQTVS